MADYKDYIVRYDIQADVTKAADGLRKIAGIANDFKEPMEKFSDAITKVSQSVGRLKEASKLTFEPKIDTGAFNNQLRSMVMQVRNAATEMHTALFEALTGNQAAQKAMRKGIVSSLGSDKSISELKRDIEAYNKELDKLLGTPKRDRKGKLVREKDGDILMAKNANMNDRILELEGRKRMFQQLIKQRKAELDMAEQLEKKAASQQAKAKSRIASANTLASETASNPQPAKLTNVTPAVIREWKKAFGDAKSKSLTINIKANAGGVNGALTVIQQVQSSLEALQAKGTFNINPVLNMEAFASAEAQFKRLATLSASITAPFIAKDERAQDAKLGSPVTSLTKDERAKLSEAQKQIKNWNEKIAGIQSRLDINKEKYEQNPTPGLKGQITRDTKMLEQYKANRAEQESVVRGIKDKTATAIQSSATKGIKPLSVDIIGNLKSIRVSGKTPVVPIVGELTKLQGKIAEAIPVNVKIMADQVAASIRSIPTPTLDVNVRLNTEGIAQQIQAISAQTKSATAKPVKADSSSKATTASTKNANTVIAAKIDTKDIISQIKNIPRQTIPLSVKLMWDKGVVGRQEQLKNLSSKIPPITLSLDTTAAIAKLEEFIALVKSNSPQNIKLTASGVGGNTATKAASVSSVVVGSAGSKPVGKISSSNVKAATSAQDRYVTMKTLAAQKAAKDKANSKHSVQKWQETNSKQQAWRDQQQAMYNRLFEAVPKPDYGWVKRMEEQRASELASMREDAKSAFAKLTPFEKKEAMAHSADVSESIARHQRQADKFKAQAYNSTLPFAKNKEQANMLAKHRKFFNRAVSSTGIVPKPGMETSQMLQYLQGVSAQMQQSNVAVPWQLQNQINKLESDIAKVNGAKQTSTKRIVSAPANQKPFFEQARKWGYPLTGNTSFGASTPMAVDMAKGAGVMFAVGGAMSAITGAFNEAVEYQNTMRTTQSILQNGTSTYTLDGFKNMERTVRDVGVKTKFSSSEVADAARFLAMAGYDINAINSSIAPIADLAIIGDTNLGETADKMTNIMTTFQIAPEKMREAANIMATTAMRSNTDLMMLAESAKYGGGVANMYGRNDPNLFADTMALFGVMGNSGIQASSAGTALRMMYMNLFNPNKKQKAMLDMLESTYGIKRFDKNGGYRSMSDILIDMAQRIPDNRMAEVIGNLFRITAQPGANAALISAVGGDINNEQEIIAGFNSVGDKMLNEGLAPLIALMKANRESMSGNISGIVSEDKQNTIKGLWAQVTSVFEEGVLKAFENREGDFRNMLKQLADYLGKPETVQMIQNLLDMVVDVAKVMAGFVKVWANIYNAVPGLMKAWIVSQMFITQIGTLISPVISLIGAFDRLGGALMRFAGVSMGIGTTVAKSNAGRTVAQIASVASYGTPFVVGTGKLGQNKTIRGNIATRANRELAENAVLAGELALSGASQKETLASLNQSTRKHYAEVRQRANKIYGPNRAWRVFKSAATTLPTVANFAPMIGGLKSMLMGLLSGLAKAIGLLVNPVTIALGAMAGLGFGIYKLVQFINGNTETQIAAQKRLAELSSSATRIMVENNKWYQEQMSQFMKPAEQLNAIGKSQKEIEYENNAKKFQDEYAYLGVDWGKGASDKGITQNLSDWRKRIDNNRLYRFAIGNDYSQMVGIGLDEVDYGMNYTGTEADSGIAFYNLLFGARDKARGIQQKIIQAALRTAGANAPIIQAASTQIADLRKQYLSKSITEEEYYKKAYAIRDSLVNLKDSRLRSSKGMTAKQFREIEDPSIYLEYALGQYNIINSFINGEMGTLVGKLNAYETLKRGAAAYSEQWFNAISHVIGDLPVQWNVMTDEGKLEQIKLQLSMLPDGQIDTAKIIEQVRGRIQNFNLNIVEFSNMMAKVYSMMAESGWVAGTKEDAQTFMQKQMQHRHITAEDAKSYFINDLSEDSPFKKAGMTVGEWQKFITDQKGAVQLNGVMFHAATERVRMRQLMSDKVVEQLFGSKDKIGSAVQSPTGKNNANASGASTQDKAQTNVLNQDDYSSHYERAAARPTQVVININELAHFDRTTVASSAEERDLIASMEPKIAEAVYRIFAEASNQAQRIVDQA